MLQNECTFEFHSDSFSAVSSRINFFSWNAREIHQRKSGLRITQPFCKLKLCSGTFLKWRIFCKVEIMQNKILKHLKNVGDFTTLFIEIVPFIYSSAFRSLYSFILTRASLINSKQDTEESHFTHLMESSLLQWSPNFSQWRMSCTTTSEASAVLLLHLEWLFQQTKALEGLICTKREFILQLLQIGPKSFCKVQKFLLNF